MATNNNQDEPQADIDYSLVPVLLEYVGPEGHYNEVINGKTYSFSTAPMYRGVVVRQEDVPELMSRAKFNISSPWYKLPGKTSKKQQVSEPEPILDEGIVVEPPAEEAKPEPEPVFVEETAPDVHE